MVRGDVTMFEPPSRVRAKSSRVSVAATMGSLKRRTTAVTGVLRGSGVTGPTRTTTGDPAS